MPWRDLKSHKTRHHFLICHVLAGHLVITKDEVAEDDVGPQRHLKHVFVVYNGVVVELNAVKVHVIRFIWEMTVIDIKEVVQLV